MRAAGDILLLGCYELGRPPLSVVSPLATLVRAGYRPRVLDLSVQEIDLDAVARARLVAISVPMHTAMRIGMEVARRVRDHNPRAHLCFYGLYATLNAGYLLAGAADSVIGGECEEPLAALAGRLEAGGREPLEGVGEPGRAAAPYLRRTPLLPPDRSQLPALDRYARLQQGEELRLAGAVETTRGCKHHCRHCPITPVYRGRFFVVPAEVVLADVDAQVRLGATHLTFADPDFLNGPGHSLRLTREIHRRHPGLGFDITTKVEHILKHRDLFPELRELGCVFVVSAIESFSDTVLERLRKGHTRADIEEALSILEAAGIPMRPSLVAFTPWTTLADYREMLEQVVRLGLIDRIDPVQYSIRLLVPPGSALLEEPESAAWIGPLDAAAFVHTWRHPDPRLDALHAEVAARVERDAAAGADPLETFLRIREAARSVGTAGLRVEPGDPPWAAEQGRIRAAAHASRRSGPVPRLTEAWFC